MLDTDRIFALTGRLSATPRLLITLDAAVPAVLLRVRGFCHSRA